MRTVSTKPATCHPERPLHCKGKCVQCYKAEQMRRLRKNPETREKQKASCREYYKENSSEILKRTRKNNRLRRYGISYEQFQEMLRLQDNRCAICGRFMEEKERDANVDHDHTSKKVRGLLCRLCNVGIGHFMDSPELLMKAAQYLLKNQPIKETQKWKSRKL